MTERSGGVAGLRPADGDGDGIAAFWAWWHATGAERCAASIDDGTAEALVEEISDLVTHVAEGLAWELTPGTTSRHRLVVTAGGVPELRATARRWLRAAPPPDTTWEYADTRLPGDVTELVLGVGGARLHLDDVRVGVERRGFHLDVTVQHPALAPLTEHERLQVAFLALDTALGEVDAETWVGSVAATAEPLSTPEPLRELPAHVSRLRADATDDGDRVWVLLRAETGAGPRMAAAMVPLVPTVAPHLDAHLAVDVPYAGRTEEGLPDEAALTALRDLEDHLAGRLGEGALLVGHETGSGRRLLHFYADSTGPVDGVVRGAVAGWPDGRVTVTLAPDAAWSAVRHLRA